MPCIYRRHLHHSSVRVLVSACVTHLPPFSWELPKPVPGFLCPAVFSPLPPPSLVRSVPGPRESVRQEAERPHPRAAEQKGGERADAGQAPVLRRRPAVSGSLPGGAGQVGGRS